MNRRFWTAPVLWRFLNRLSATAPEDWRSPKRWRDQLGSYGSWFQCMRKRETPLSMNVASRQDCGTFSLSPSEGERAGVRVLGTVHGPKCMHKVETPLSTITAKIVRKVPDPDIPGMARDLHSHS